MSRPPLADIGALNTRLAEQLVRLTSFVESLPRATDQLIAATEVGNWHQVGQLCHSLVHSGHSVHCPEVSSAAQAVCNALALSDNPIVVRRRVMHLVGVCGQVRMPSSGSAR